MRTLQFDVRNRFLFQPFQIGVYQLLYFLRILVGIQRRTDPEQRWAAPLFGVRGNALNNALSFTSS